jgi:hypothetical protein
LLIEPEPDYKKLYFELLEKTKEQPIEQNDELVRKQQKPEQKEEYDTFLVSSNQIFPFLGKKISIHLPYRYKDKAKQLGAKYDKETKDWYVIEGSPDSWLLIDAFKKSNFDKYGKFLETREFFDKFCGEFCRDEYQDYYDSKALERINLKKREIKKVLTEPTEEEQLELELSNLLN